MKVINNTIVEATGAELRDIWLTNGYDDIYSFPDFLAR